MAGEQSSYSNPLSPLSLPFAIRAALGATLAVSLLLGAAQDLVSGFAGNSMTALFTALVLLGVAIGDGIRAFRTRVRLPERSVGMGGISCNGAEMQGIMLSGANPNEKYLSWIGRWAARVWARFAALPVVYQRLVEVAVTAVAFGMTAAAIFALFLAFGRSSGKFGLALIIAGWLLNSFVVLAYGFWAAMLANFFGAARFARKLSVSRIVNLIGSVILLFATVSFIVQMQSTSIPRVPRFPVEYTVLAFGSLLIVVALFVLARLRSTGVSPVLRRSRIQLSDTSAVHPQSISGAFGSALAQTRSGAYHELSDSQVNLKEHQNTEAGTFESIFAGEYGARITRIGSEGSLRTFGTFLGWIGIGLGAVSCVLLFLAVGRSSGQLGSASVCILLFGELAALVAYYPLSEVLCTSYLVGMQVRGNYQKRGVAGAGSILTDYTIDGGLARASSVCFVSAAMARVEIRRAVAAVMEDSDEEKTFMQAVKVHLARAAAPRSDSGS